MKIMQDRMKEGRAEAFRTGRYLGGACPPPYRYDKASGMPTVDPESLNIMRRLWALAETHGCSSIAREMAMPLISVRRALQEERLLFYQSIRIDPETSQSICCEWPAVMTAEQAELIRARREDRKRGYSRSRYGGLLSNLGGILTCGYCGRTARSWSNSRIDSKGNSPTWYGCKAKESKGTCDSSRFIPQHELNGAVITNILNTISDPHELKAAWLENLDTSDKSEELTAISKQVAALQVRKQRMVHAISEGVIDFTEARKVKAEIEAAIQSAETRRAQLLSDIPIEIDWESLAVNPDDFKASSPELQRELILSCISEIKIYQSYATINYRFPRNLSGSTLTRIHLTTPAKPL
jgi:hypothetical protein